MYKKDNTIRLGGEGSVLDPLVITPASLRLLFALADHRVDLLQLSVDLGAVVLLLLLRLEASRLPSLRLLHAVLVGRLGHRLQARHVVAVLLLRLKVPPTDGTLLVAHVHLTEVGLVVGVTHGVVGLRETRVALVVARNLRLLAEALKVGLRRVGGK